MEEALRYVRKRWGDRGVISCSQNFFVVGVEYEEGKGGKVFYVFGRGDTWRKAVRHAETNDSEVEKRYLN